MDTQKNEKEFNLGQRNSNEEDDDDDKKQEYDNQTKQEIMVECNSRTAITNREYNNDVVLPPMWMANNKTNMEQTGAIECASVQPSISNSCTLPLADGIDTYESTITPVEQGQEQAGRPLEREMTVGYSSSKSQEVGTLPHQEQQQQRQVDSYVVPTIPVSLLLSQPGAFHIYPRGKRNGSVDQDVESGISENDDHSTVSTTSTALPCLESTIVDEEGRINAIRLAYEEGRQAGIIDLAVVARKSVIVHAEPIPVDCSMNNLMMSEQSNPKKRILGVFQQFILSKNIVQFVCRAMIVIVIVTITFVPILQINKDQMSSISAHQQEQLCFENLMELLNAVDTYLLYYPFSNNRTNLNNETNSSLSSSITNWCISKITNLDHVFSTDRNPLAEHFEADLSGWDVSNVTSMVGMFMGARRFKGIGLDYWKVSSLINMSSMFEQAWSMDANLSNWDVSKVTTLNSMFSDASQFRGTGLNHWNVSQVRDMTRMFHRASIMDANFSQWDVSQVEKADQMFMNASSFRGFGLKQWLTANINNMTGMFFGASSFNANLSLWNVSRVTNMSMMFAGASEFSGMGLELWDVSHVIDTEGLCWEASNFNTDLSFWDVSKVISMEYMFRQASSFHGIGIDSWNTSQVVDLDGMFMGATTFDANLTSWDVSRVTSMRSTFQSASNFTGIGLQEWNVSSIQNMDQAFLYTSNFDADLSRWNVSRVTDMGGMFAFTLRFRGIGLEQWDVSRVQSLAGMFWGASLFDGNLSTWDVSRVTEFVNLFREAPSFRGLGGLYKWDVSKSHAMYNMFQNASSFCGIGLEAWDVSNVLDMYMMFYGATSFDCDLSYWNVSNVVDMNEMFVDAVQFRGIGLDHWIPSNVNGLSNFLNGAVLFNTSLCSWGQHILPDVNTTAMFVGTSCPWKDAAPNMNSFIHGAFCYPCNLEG